MATLLVCQSTLAKFSMMVWPEHEFVNAGACNCAMAICFIEAARQPTRSPSARDRMVRSPAAMNTSSAVAGVVAAVAMVERLNRESSNRIWMFAR